MLLTTTAADDTQEDKTAEETAHQRIRAVALIPCQILALIHHVEYANIDAEVKA